MKPQIIMRRNNEPTAPPTIVATFTTANEAYDCARILQAKTNLNVSYFVRYKSKGKEVNINCSPYDIVDLFSYINESYKLLIIEKLQNGKLNYFTKVI